MLEFSDAAYQFFESKPSKPIIWLSRKLNRSLVLPGRGHQIAEIDLQGVVDAAREAIQNGDRVLFVANHPTHSDPQVITEIHRRLGVPSCFMAAYDIYLRSRFTAWLMQRLGHFSIDREGSDRKAMSAAIETIKAGKMALTIFPEGNVFLTNDRLAPILDGTAFIALKAQSALESGSVKVIPISLKYTHLTKPREVVTDRLRALARDSGHEFPSGALPLPAILGLGAHIISDLLEKQGYEHNLETDEEKLLGSLRALKLRLVTDLENELSITPKEGQSSVERIRKLRSAIHQIRTDDSTDPESESVRSMAERAILAFRIYWYIQPYLTDHPSVDRYDETVERIAEDFYSRAMPRTGPRKVIARVHEPLDAKDYLEKASGKLRNAIGCLTRDMESSLQRGIDRSNLENTAPGADPVE